MKTRNVLTRVLFAMAAVVTLTHCGSSGNNNNNAAVTGAGYYVSGGNCYNSANQIVGTAATCPVSGVNTCGVNGVSGYNTGYNTGYNGYNTGYGYNGVNNGYNGVNGINNGYNTNCAAVSPYGAQTGYGYGQQCIGNYVTASLQPVVCQGQCHGVTLYSYPTYQQVYCQ